MVQVAIWMLTVVLCAEELDLGYTAERLTSDMIRLVKVEVTPNVTKPIFLESFNVPGTSECTYLKLGLLMYGERLNRGSVVGEGVSTEVVI